MQYTKKDLASYKLHLIKTDRFKEIVITLRLTKPYEKES